MTELWVVAPDGELRGRTPSLGEALERVAELEAQLADLERDMRRARFRERLLLAQLEDKRRDYDRKDEVVSVFDEWRKRCGHRRARLSDDRFDAIRGILEVSKPQPYPREAFSLAISGAAFDPFVTRRRNGSQHRHDDIALVCRDGKTFEEFIRRAPMKGEMA